MGVVDAIQHPCRVGLTVANITLLFLFGRFSCWHFRFTIPSLVRGGRGRIPRLTFACIPEAENVKKIPFIVESDKDEPGKDDIEVEFENIENYLGKPAPCRIFIGTCGSKERPSMFWRLFSGGSGKAADSEADANMQMWKIKVGIPFGGDLIKPDVQPSAGATEASRMDDAVRQLKPQVEPDSIVSVIIPILVNHKAIAAKSKLQLHKVATDKKEKKEKCHVALDVLGEWTTKRKALSSEEAKPKSAKKSK